MLTFLQQHPVYRRPITTKPRTAGDALPAQASNVSSILRAQPRVQAKLQHTTPGDAFEREADRVAGEVMRKQDNECSCGGGCPKCRAAAMKSPAPEHQTLSKAETDEGISAGVARALNSPGKPIDESTRNFFEQRFGRDFGGVRVHDNRTAGEAARSINARAFTVGNHIAFGQGFYAPAPTRDDTCWPMSSFT